MTKNTKKAVWASALSIIMCLSLLIGTTFAWFTDTASTSVNKIQAGTLDVELQMLNDEGNWVNAENEPLQFKVGGQIPAASTQILWEPGCTYELPALRVVNKGDLALKYKVEITGINGDAKLNEAIVWTINNAPINLTEKILAVGEKSAAFVIKGHMKEEAGNEYQGLCIDGVSITVYAAQYTSEIDGTDDQYDKDATYPIEILAVIKNAAMTKHADGSFTYANSDNTVTASIPGGITVTEGEKPEVNVAPINGGNITTTAAGKNAIGYDISIANVTLGDTLAKVSFKLGTGLQNVEMKHSGVAMTKVASESELTANNTFYYDETSGMVTIAVNSFSPFTAEFDAPVASIDGKSYYSLQEAFNVGGEVVLQNDVLIPTTKTSAADRLTIRKATTLNFNGYKIIAPGELEPTSNWAALYVAADTTFNADEEGGILCLDKENGECGTYAVNVIGGANLTVNGGTYYGGGTVFQVQLGNLAINGGSFAATPFGEPYVYNFVINCVDGNYKNGTATVTIKGGSFKNFNPANNEAEGAKTSFVAPGCEILTENDTYSVYVGTLVCTAAELQELLTNYGAAGAGDNTVAITTDLRLAEGQIWNPILVAGDKGAGIVTINGNGHTIYGLNAPLFSGSWAGKSGIIINDLTLANANVAVDVDDANGNVGVGAFIGWPSASETITLNNCHLVNSTVKGGHWAGGLIGIAGGYGTEGDGPVFETVTIKDCSVVNCTIESKGSAGAIFGHATCDIATKVIIDNCKITGSTVKSTGSATNKAGSLMGTVGIAGSVPSLGHDDTGVYVTGCTVTGNTVTSNTTVIDRVYGRLGSAGKLVVDGVVMTQEY